MGAWVVNSILGLGRSITIGSKNAFPDDVLGWALRIHTLVGLCQSDDCRIGVSGGLGGVCMAQVMVKAMLLFRIANIYELEALFGETNREYRP
jgi:hypothetical protein